MSERVTRGIEGFERVIVGVLTVLLMIIVALTSADVAWRLVEDIVSPPFLLLSIDEMLDLLGFVLLVLAGVELLETLKAYLNSRVVHVEIVIEVALIAIARKVVVVELDKYSAASIAAMAALVVALTIALHVIRRSAGRQARA